MDFIDLTAKAEKSSLDGTDLKILRALQADASRSVTEIAQEVGLSQTPCWRRIKRLHETGVIRSVMARLDPEALGLRFTAYAFVKLALPSTANLDRFDEFVHRHAEIVSCERITGAVDYLIKVVAVDIADYDNFLRFRLLATDLVSDVQSHIVVSQVKETAALPLPEG
ncbi:MAG: Lrp/AsnC family transcriptional regulator [Pseudomonadota bacterium]